jgi:hypothetical protein
MIGGVRSPMATSGHGLVGRKTSMKISGMSSKRTKDATVISSPQRAGDNV